MSRRATFAFATLVLVACVGTAGAQGASLAVGVANPVGSFANGVASGFDAAFQVRTEPMFGPLALRIELAYDFFSGKNGSPGAVVSGEGIGVVGDIGSAFYWVLGPGHFGSTVKTQIDGHAVTERADYFGLQGAAGVNVPVFGLDWFVEVDAMKLFSPGLTIGYVPLRLGIRL